MHIVAGLIIIAIIVLGLNSDTIYNYVLRMFPLMNPALYGTTTPEQWVEAFRTAHDHPTMALIMVGGPVVFVIVVALLCYIFKD